MLELLESTVELRKIARNWHLWAEKIAESSKNILVPCDVYAFGSVARGESAGASDIDILIVSKHLPKDTRGRSNLKAQIEEKAGLPLHHQFVIHLATRNEAAANPIYRAALREGLTL